MVSFWIFCYVSVYFAGHKSGGTVTPLHGLIYFYMAFSFYWVSQVLRNVAHVTTSGAVAMWFLTPQAVNRVVGSFWRAVTTSFGSICLGSFIVAALQVTLLILRHLRDQSRRQGNWLCYILLCFIECWINYLESWVEYFNKYAFTQVAIYGKPFMEAGKDTWRLWLYNDSQ